MTKVPDYDREYPDSGIISYLPCAALSDHPLRLGFYGEIHLQKLIDAIKTDGLLQPIIVYPLNHQQFQILSGHYRIRAVRRLRRQSVPCTVFQGDNEDALRIYCTSNLLTRGLNPIEEAHIIAELIRTRGMTMDKIGVFLGHGKSWVSRRLKMLNVLDPKIRKFVESGELQPRFAQELTKLPQGNDQQRVWALIQKQHMTKDAASSLVNWWLTATEAERFQAEATPPRKPPTPDLAQYATKALKMCCTSLKELVFVLGQHSFPWERWPQREWLHLGSVMHTLTNIVVTRPEKGD